jgi:3,4-dihydroxy 2-butanone 4-phosphate synthase/GTP cyclohydrolase II
VNAEEAFARVEAAVRALWAGRMAVVRDDAARENEGDLVLAAELATANALALMARLGGGLICAPITAARANALGLGLVSPTNTTPTGTALLTPVDVVGCTTGISAAERAATARALADPATHPEDLLRPGHLFPLQAHEDGLRARQGHTEAAVELARLAGLAPAGVICEVLGEDGAPLRGEALEAFAARHGLPLLAVADLVAYLDAGQGPVRRVAASTLPTRHGVFQAMVYRELATGAEHLALVAGTPQLSPAPLVRLHSACLTGDVLGSLRCDCGAQLTSALTAIAQEGGIVLYLAQEGRSIGLANKIRAYALQEQGLDTLEANLALGLPADARDYTAGAAILRDLGVTTVRLMTNNPAKVRGLEAHGVRIDAREPLLVEASSHSAAYLATKARRLGHLIPPDAIAG